jgi:hypothetical protein
MVLPVRLNQIRLVFASINSVLMDSCSLLTITIVTRAGTRAEAATIGAVGTVGAVTVTVTIPVTVTVAALPAVVAIAVTVASLTSVAAAISSSVAALTSVATSISAAATAITTTTAAAGQDDFSLKNVIGCRVQIRGEAVTEARRVDRTGCCAPGRYGCQK